MQNVASFMRLPDLDDMDYDPAGVYQALTGVENLAATVQDCMSVVLEKVTEKVQALSKRAENRQSSGQNYTYVETDFCESVKTRVFSRGSGAVHDHSAGSAGGP